MKYYSFILVLSSIILGCNGEAVVTEPANGPIEELTEDNFDSVEIDETAEVLELEIINSGSDWYKMNLEGDVHKIIIREYSVDEEWDEMGMGGSFEEYGFNVNGKNNRYLQRWLLWCGSRIYRTYL